jgi:hypothetical protein
LVSAFAPNRHRASANWGRQQGTVCAPIGRHLDQFEAFQAGVAFLADDDVVVHGNAERGSDSDDLLRHLDVGVRRRRIA